MFLSPLVLIRNQQNKALICFSVLNYYNCFCTFGGGGFVVSSGDDFWLPIMMTLPMVGQECHSREVASQGCLGHVTYARTQSPPGPLESSTHFLHAGTHFHACTIIAFSH